MTLSPPATPPDPALDTKLAPRIGRGVFWAYLAYAGAKGLVFVSTVILGRLLTPADFGLVGLASLVTEYLGTVHTFGVGAAFIQRRDDPEEAANATFVISTGSGVALFLISLLLSPWAVDFFKEPQVGIMLPLLASTYVITGLTAVNDALLVKNLRFRQRMVPVVTQALVKGAVSIGLALAGAGAWSLVWGVVIGTLASNIALVLISPWRVTRAWNRRVMRDILGFGGHIILLNFIGNIEVNVDYLIVGKRLGKESLGYYTMGFRMPELLIVNIVSVVSGVVFPVYSKMQGDRDGLRRSLLKTMQFIALVAVPAGVGLALVSDTFIHLFYTDKWAATIPVMQLLSIYAAIRALTYNFGDVYKAVGRPDILNKIGVFTLVITVIALWIGSAFGIVGVAGAHVSVAVINFLIDVAVVWRLLGVPPWRVLAAISGPVAGAGGMAAAMWAVGALIHPAPGAAQLIALIATGAAAYLALSWIINRPVILTAIQLVRQIIPRPAADR
nr:lipopolysaccharide biosynthesis protein [Chloroflexota bacterium]